jgi:hypothetical protein
LASEASCVVVASIVGLGVDADVVKGVNGVMHKLVVVTAVTVSGGIGQDPWNVVVFSHHVLSSTSRPEGLPHRHV